MNTLRIITLTASILLIHMQASGQMIPGEPGGGGMPVEIHCNDQAIDRDALQILHSKTISRLRAEGKLGDFIVDEPVKFIFPLAQKEGVNDPGFHGTSNFVDHNPEIGQLTDFMGNQRTYDLSSGYNHRGTDYYLWPFNWNKVQDDEVEVVAAAAGTILQTVDGNPDQSCSFEGAGQWNAAFLVHDDGSRTWYGHMKNGSVTTKADGERVESGERLGVVASSGMSSGPHLHFEVYDNEENLIDPYSGPSNPTTTESWWLNQPDYYDSGINKIIFHSTPPEFKPCPQIHTINETEHVDLGVTFHAAVYYRDQLKDQVSSFRFLNPEGVPVFTWNHHSTADHFASSWWYWNLSVSHPQTAGVYTFEVNYEGVLYTRKITAGTITSLDPDDNIPGNFQLLQNFPNPFNPSTHIRFYLPEDSPVRLAVYDLTGREVALLEDMHFPAGEHVSSFDAVNLSSGVYMYRLEAGNFSQVKKMTLLK